MHEPECGAAVWGRIKFRVFNFFWQCHLSRVTRWPHGFMWTCSTPLSMWRGQTAPTEITAHGKTKRPTTHPRAERWSRQIPNNYNYNMVSFWKSCRLSNVTLHIKLLPHMAILPRIKLLGRKYTRNCTCWNGQNISDYHSKTVQGCINNVLMEGIKC